MKKKILIIDEYGFSRICSAILDSAGFATELAQETKGVPERLDNNEVGLIITSYPYASSLVEEIKVRRIPTIILSDKIDRNLVAMLNDMDNSYCMVKPLDYERFRLLVGHVMGGASNVSEEYNIV